MISIIFAESFMTEHGHFVMFVVQKDGIFDLFMNDPLDTSYE
jgi:hypothetical protein